MREITIYRVRKSFRDIKSQKGAFLLFASAVKCAEKHRLNVYDDKGRILFSAMVSSGCKIAKNNNRQ